MAKYEKRADQVEADVYAEGMEDGFAYEIEGVGFLTEDEAIESNYSIEGRQKVPFLMEYGEKVLIDEGDYILTYPNGVKGIMTKENFEAMYKAVQ